MCIAIAGGVKKMERDYLDLSRKYGIKCKLFNRKVPDFKKRIQNVDAVVVFTGVVGHKMVEMCNKTCKKKGICMKRIHSSSVKQLEKAFQEIQAGE